MAVSALPIGHKLQEYRIQTLLGAGGFGLTYLVGLGLLLEERIAFGAVLGGTIVSGASLLVSLVVRDVTPPTVLAALGFVVLVGAAAAVWVARALRPERASNFARADGAAPMDPSRAS